MLRHLNVAFIVYVLSFVIQYGNLQSMFSLKWMFERATLCCVGRYRLSTECWQCLFCAAGFPTAVFHT